MSAALLLHFVKVWPFAFVLLFFLLPEKQVELRTRFFPPSGLSLSFDWLWQPLGKNMPERWMTDQICFLFSLVLLSLVDSDAEMEMVFHSQINVALVSNMFRFHIRRVLQGNRCSSRCCLVAIWHLSPRLVLFYRCFFSHTHNASILFP